MRVLTVAIEKGGIGKTTSVINLAHLFCEDGYKVLVIDCDPQANATLTLTGVSKAEWNDRGIFELVQVCGLPVDKTEFIQHSPTPGIDIIPSNRYTKQLLGQLKILSENKGVATYKFLKQSIEDILPAYDIVLIDTPPSQDDLTVSALYACTDVVIPIVADTYSREGLINTLALVEELRRKEGVDINVAGIFFVKSERTVVQDIYREQIAESELSKLLFATEIRKGQPVVESIEQKTAVVTAYPKSNPAKDYRALYAELKKRMGG